MAVKCIDHDVDFEIVNINTADDNINQIANRYLRDRHINAQQSVGFNSMLLNISNQITVNKNNTDDLVYHFNIYTQLCSICNILPDMTGYAMFIDVSYDTMQDWLSGQNRSKTHTQIFKKMRDFCKLTCVSEAGRGNVGAIYVSKALHGLSDAPAPASYTQNNLYITAPDSRDDILAAIGQKTNKNALPEP